MIKKHCNSTKQYIYLFLIIMLVGIFVLSGCDGNSSNGTNVQSKINMPNVVGHTVQETEQMFKDKGFTNIKFENEYENVDKETGVICEQNVQEGEEISPDYNLVFKTINDRDLAYFRGKVKDFDSYVDNYIEYRNSEDTKENVMQSKERRLLRTFTGMKKFYEYQTNPSFREYYAKDIESILNKASNYFKFPEKWNPYKIN